MTTTTEYGTWCNRVDRHSSTVEDSVTDAFGDEVPDGFDFDAIVSDYRAAINEALPDGVTLAGDQFYGPYYKGDRNFDGYPLGEDGALDFKAIVDDIDLWAIIRRHETTVSRISEERAKEIADDLNSRRGSSLDNGVLVFDRAGNGGTWYSDNTYGFGDDTVALPVGRKYTTADVLATFNGDEVTD